MGFWDFFRAKEEKKEPEKIKLEELESWILARKNEIKNQEAGFLKLVQERINQLIQELEEEISALKEINVEEKKAEAKVKLIVRENLNYYINYLEKLVERLKEIKIDKNIIEKINFIFPDFEKRSSASFEKATFLIGKKLGDVKESIKNFFRELEKIINENKESLDKSRALYLVEAKMEKFNEIKKTKSEIEKLIRDYDNQTNVLKEKIKLKEKEAENIKKSEKFMKEEKKKEELEKKRLDLDKEIYKLRGLVDFKALTRFFHSFQKEMNLIGEYRENFKEAFQKNNGDSLLGLLREAKMPDADISKKIEEIAQKKKEIESTIIEKTGIEKIEAEIIEIKAEIESINSKKLIEEKRDNRAELNSQEIVNSIKEELSKINVKLEEL